jgi:hypothetical protein
MRELEFLDFSGMEKRTKNIESEVYHLKQELEKLNEFMKIYGKEIWANNIIKFETLVKMERARTDKDRRNAFSEMWENLRTVEVDRFNDMSPEQEQRFKEYTDVPREEIRKYIDYIKKQYKERDDKEDIYPKKKQ